MVANSPRKQFGFWLCNHGFHKWRQMYGHRHAHMKCMRVDCGKQEIWANHNMTGGYVPAHPGWGLITRDRGLILAEPELVEMIGDKPPC